MSDEKDDQSEREIIQVRRIIPKKKAAPSPPQPDEELKAKTKELKKRVFQMQIALGISLFFFVFLGLRSVGCLRKSPESSTASNASDARSNAPINAYPIGVSDRFPLTPSPLEAPLDLDDANASSRLGADSNAFSDSKIQGRHKNLNNDANPNRRDVFRGVDFFRDVPPLAPFQENGDICNKKELIKTTSEGAANSDVATNASPQRTRSDSSNFAQSAPNGFRNSRDVVNFPENLRVVRIATWNLGAFDFAKLSDFNAGQKVAKIVREFDIVALQGIRAKNLAVLDGLVYLIANEGDDYAYVASTPGRRDEILAIFFNANVVEVDRSTVSDVFDSQGRLATPGLVAAFQTANVDAKKRFTFQMIDCDLSNDISPNGAALADAYRTLRKKAGALGVSEDDVLLAGDFGVAIQKIKELGAVPNLVAIHVDKATDADGGSSANILFDSVATTEYVERFGVVNLADYFDISAAEAAKIAPTRPVWADFSVYEGGDAHFSASPSEPFNGQN